MFICSAGNWAVAARPGCCRPWPSAWAVSSFPCTACLSSLQSAVWTPLILFFLLRSFARPSRGYPLLTAGSVLCQFLGGGIEIFLMTQGLVLLTALRPGLWVENRARIGPLERWKTVGKIYLVFAGLGAIQILPFLEMVRHSARGLGLTYAEATAWSLSFRDLWYLVLPDVFWRGMEYYFDDQNWLRSIYLGTDSPDPGPGFPGPGPGSASGHRHPAAGFTGPGPRKKYFIVPGPVSSRARGRIDPLSDQVFFF